jgi:transcriptional regulator GlxA family with amidase domain
MQHASMLGVHFRPGGAAPVLGLPASEIVDEHVDLRSLWGVAGRELRERLCTAATPARRFGMLEEVLLKRLLQTKMRHEAVSIALNAFEQAPDTLKVRDLARRVGLSQRRFIQVFKQEVGLTPKLYSRVRRFQRVREFVRQAVNPDWAAVAVQCGFFDQSHLIRDFEEFTGLSPVIYVDQMTRHVMLNHVPWVG